MMTVDELAQILKKMYDEPDRKKNQQIILFGIKYSRELQRGREKNSQVVRHVIRLSGIGREASVEINAGIGLAQYVDLKPLHRR